MDVNLNPAMEAKDVSVSGVGAFKLLQYTLSLFRLVFSFAFSNEK